MANTDSTSVRRRYAALVIVVMAVALVGFIGFVLYPGDVSGAQGIGLFGLAAVAGVASFFSPCSFPLLLALLGRPGPSRKGRSVSPIVFGSALALGAAGFMVAFGVVIAIGGRALFAGIGFTSTAGIAIRTVVGALLILLGLAQVGVLKVSMHPVARLAQPMLRGQARLRRERPIAGFALFGFGYVLAGFG